MSSKSQLSPAGPNGFVILTKASRSEPWVEVRRVKSVLAALRYTKGLASYWIRPATKSKPKKADGVAQGGDRVGDGAATGTTQNADAGQCGERGEHGGLLPGVDWYAPESAPDAPACVSPDEDSDDVARAA